MSRMSESPKGPNARTQVGPDVEFSSPGRESVVACFDERRRIGHRVAHIVMRDDRSRSCCLPGSAQQGSSMRCSTIRFVRIAYADVARGISRMPRAPFRVRAKITAGPDGERKPSEMVSPSLVATGGNGDLGDAVSRRFAAAKRCSSFCANPYRPNGASRPALRHAWHHVRPQGAGAHVFNRDRALGPVRSGVPTGVGSPDARCPTE